MAVGGSWSLRSGPVTLSTTSRFEGMSAISRPGHNGLLQADTADLMNMVAVFLEETTFYNR